MAPRSRRAPPAPETPRGRHRARRSRPSFPTDARPRPSDRAGARSERGPPRITSTGTALPVGARHLLGDDARPPSPRRSRPRAAPTRSGRRTPRPTRVGARRSAEARRGPSDRDRPRPSDRRRRPRSRSSPPPRSFRVRSASGRWRGRARSTGVRPRRRSPRGIARPGSAASRVDPVAAESPQRERAACGSARRDRGSPRTRSNHRAWRTACGSRSSGRRPRGTR